MNDVNKTPNRIDRFKGSDAEYDSLESESDAVPRAWILGWSEFDWKKFKITLVISSIVAAIFFSVFGFKKEAPVLTPQQIAEEARLNKLVEKDQMDRKRESWARQQQAEEEVMNPALAEARRRASQPINIGVAPGPGNTATICATQGDTSSCRTIIQGADGKAYVR